MNNPNRRSRLKRRTRPQTVGNERIPIEPLESRRLLSAYQLFPYAPYTSGISSHLSGMVFDGSGGFYCISSGGGADEEGQILHIPAGSNTPVAVAYFDGADGEDPEGDLLLSNGVLYGTTTEGGTNSDGTIWQMTISDSNITPLASFDGSDGVEPNGGLAIDSSGNLYGTTQAGGISLGPDDETAGTLFKYSVATQQITDIVQFDGSTGGSDPKSGLTTDGNGDFFGTTSTGANGATLFEYSPATAAFSTRATFASNVADDLIGDVAIDTAGNIFGNAQSPGYGCVWEYTAATQAVSQIAAMTGYGGAPFGDVAIDSADNVFGTTQSDSAGSSGSAYEVVNGSAKVTYLAIFNVNTTGEDPQGTVLFNPTTSDVFGLTVEGAGTNHDGAVWDLTTHGNPFPAGGGGAGAGGTATGLSPSVLSSTIPSKLINSSTIKLHGALKMNFTNSGPVNETDVTVNVLASASPTLGGSADFPVTTLANPVNVNSGKSLRLTIPIVSLPNSLPNGAYYFIVETVDAFNNVISAATASPVNISAAFVSLSETLTDSLATQLVSGNPTRGSVTLAITNSGNIASGGSTGFEITASATPGAVGASFVNLSKTLNIAPGKSTRVTVPIKTTPAGLVGDYFIVSQVTDPFSGGVSIASSTGTTTFVAPFISISAALGPVSRLQSGDTATVTNNGNTDDVTALTGAIGFSTDPLGTISAGGTTADVHPFTIKVGKSIRFHSTEWADITAGLTTGDSYYLTLTVTDTAGNTAFAVSPNSFTF